MTNFRHVVLILISLAPAFAAELLDPAAALDRYLARVDGARASCGDSVWTVRIDASMPKLNKQGGMSGLKLVSQTGRTLYRGLRFTGDDLIKSKVIARFLDHEIGPADETTGAGLTRDNYSFVYDRTAEYNGLAAYVFLLKPRRKRTGLFKGELWLDALAAHPLRLWGDLLKSPSIFIRGFRFVEDYLSPGECVQPSRLLLTARTRIAGLVEMEVWLHSFNGGLTQQ